MRAFYFGIAFLLYNTSSLTQAQTFESSNKPVSLIELYTSEGCSSCPPADRWLSALTDDKALWSGFVPMAFHVDYWDYIGWKDPYASEEYSQRQRRYAHQFKERTVYTPGMRKDGEEWRSWRFFGKPESDSDVDVGKISITVNSDGEFKATFANNKSPSDDIAGSLRLNVAILGVDLVSEVTSGENHGKTLKHDFVVLGISSYASSDSINWTGQLPQASVEAPRYAVAAWVTQGQNLEPIQATGGYLASSQ